MLDRGNHCGSGDVWVCNSDGYVGQVCILRMGAQIQVRIDFFCLSMYIKQLSSCPQSTPSFLVAAYNKNAKCHSSLFLLQQTQGGKFIAYWCNCITLVK